MEKKKPLCLIALSEGFQIQHNLILDESVSGTKLLKMAKQAAHCSQNIFL